MPLASRYVRSPSLVAGVSGLSRKRRSRPEPVAQVELHGDPLDVDSDPRLLDDEGLRRSRGWTSPAPARPGLRQPPRPRRLPLPRTLTSTVARARTPGSRSKTGDPRPPEAPRLAGTADPKGGEDEDVHDGGADVGRPGLVGTAEGFGRRPDGGGEHRPGQVCGAGKHAEDKPDGDGGLSQCKGIREELGVEVHDLDPGADPVLHQLRLARACVGEIAGEPPYERRLPLEPRVDAPGESEDDSQTRQGPPSSAAHCNGGGSRRPALGRRTALRLEAMLRNTEGARALRRDAGWRRTLGLSGWCLYESDF